MAEYILAKVFSFLDITDAFWVSRRVSSPEYNYFFQMALFSRKAYLLGAFLVLVSAAGVVQAENDDADDEVTVEVSSYRLHDLNKLNDQKTR